MKKTLTVILGFAIVLAACLGLAELVDWLRPEREPAAEVEAEPVQVANVMDEAAATVILLRGDTAEISGRGAAAVDGGVTIAYPGTYRLSGALDGQLIIDCEDFHGGVYLMLEGAAISCADGPAIHVKQSEKTVLYLVPGAENSLADGAGYELDDGKDVTAGAAIYCEDDLYIEGPGALTVTGRSADGIRSKDRLVISEGVLTVYAADDGLQGSDCVELLGGTVTVGAYGDGIASPKGDITLSDGAVTVTSGGDGLAAAEDVYLLGGGLAVTAYGGAEGYEAMALQEASAKGVKGRSVTISGGAYALDTADDAIHGETDVTISGGAISIRAGDDAVDAGKTLTVAGGEIAVETCYEGLEAAEIAMTAGAVRLAAENSGVEAMGGFTMTGGELAVAAPRCVNAAGLLAVWGGELRLTATGGDTPLRFAQSDVTGGTVIVTGAGTAEELQSGGVLPGSLLFVLPRQLAADAPVTLLDASGAVKLAFQTAQPSGVIWIASGAMGPGQSYTLSAGDWALTGELTEECTVVR